MKNWNLKNCGFILVVAIVFLTGCSHQEGKTFKIFEKNGKYAISLKNANSADLIYKYSKVEVATVGWDNVSDYDWERIWEEADTDSRYGQGSCFKVYDDNYGYGLCINDSLVIPFDGYEDIVWTNRYWPNPTRFWEARQNGDTISLFTIGGKPIYADILKENITVEYDTSSICLCNIYLYEGDSVFVYDGDRVYLKKGLKKIPVGKTDNIIGKQ
jgi:hypothetical protein